ncbi:hypothetical protein AKO1_014484 [Acrasis kona]|uniref:Uncharacterized protein n=1 Tax=Acrasis kona TaxID=1008807 RepID=A0AAW2Z3X2_9EUKA
MMRLLVLLSFVAAASFVTAFGGGGGFRSGGGGGGYRAAAPVMRAPAIPAIRSPAISSLMSPRSIGGPSYRPPSFSTTNRAPPSNAFVARTPFTPFRAPQAPAFRPAFRPSSNFGLSGPRMPASSLTRTNIDTSSFKLTGPSAPRNSIGAAPSIRYGFRTGAKPVYRPPAFSQIGTNRGYGKVPNPGFTIGGKANNRFNTNVRPGTMFGNNAFGPNYFQKTRGYQWPKIGMPNLRYGYKPGLKAQTFANNGLKIDHNFIKKEEGMKLNMYVPTRHGKVN